ncbi:MAG: D-alanyl-D-alanine endopeptidase [Candidatus Accumulibacter sp.]|uniref:D-alanyl-D-alanine endopeptidase n=1 Tax=Candidatus Accumulibacter affinis TaxID=2954384 RepID=A0A935TD55_9PROT|nr:D-alanyl-D-alanine endopeptidase [Candidatus Accumulibacter affinis]
MRITLKAALLVGAMVGTAMTPMEAVHATDKSKDKAASQKSKAAPAAQKSVVKPVAQKDKVAPASRKDASRSVASKSELKPGAGKSKTALARQGAVAPAAHKDKTGPRVAKAKVAPVARHSRYVAAPTSNGLAQAIHKKNLTRVLASNFDIWQEPGQLAVQSGSALVIAQDGGEPLYEKNANAVVPIASITKLMTAMVVLDSMPNLQATISISDEDVDYLRGSRSRLGVGTVITRETALLLALMSSENRAANSLGRHYPGGLPAFVAAMNRKALSLGMTSSQFADPTGLNSNNVSTAHDLARMVAAAHRYPLIREFSTTPGVRAEVRGRELDFHNTNQLVSSPTWEIGLSKTGYIQEAGKCLVMQARVADKPVVIVLLDSAGKQTRIGDANRIKRWMESATAAGRLPTRV